MGKPTPNFDQLPSRNPERTRRYAGVGSRRTPANIEQCIELISEFLTKDKSYRLLTGDATGADAAFTRGAMKALKALGSRELAPEIYVANDATPKAIQIARELHPAPQYLKDYALKLMARNAFQVFGPKLDNPVDFVLCWTPDGCESDQTRTRDTGGTGQAISLASLKGIPVINLGRPGRLEQIAEEHGLVLPI